MITDTCKFKVIRQISPALTTCLHIYLVCGDSFIH